MVSKAFHPAVRTSRGLWFGASILGIQAHSAQFVPTEAEPADFDQHKKSARRFIGNGLVPGIVVFRELRVGKSKVQGSMSKI
jgi:hypothetical protein